MEERRLLGRRKNDKTKNANHSSLWPGSLFSPPCPLSDLLHVAPDQQVFCAGRSAFRCVVLRSRTWRFIMKRINPLQNQNRAEESSQLGCPGCQEAPQAEAGSGATDASRAGLAHRLLNRCHPSGTAACSCYRAHFSHVAPRSAPRNCGPACDRSPSFPSLRHVTAPLSRFSLSSLFSFSPCLLFLLLLSLYFSFDTKSKRTWLRTLSA